MFAAQTKIYSMEMVAVHGVVIHAARNIISFVLTLPLWMLWETRALNVLITALIRIKYPMLLLKDKLEEKISDQCDSHSESGTSSSHKPTGRQTQPAISANLSLQNNDTAASSVKSGGKTAPTCDLLVVSSSIGKALEASRLYGQKIK